MGKLIGKPLAPDVSPTCPTWLATVTLRLGVSEDEISFYALADRKFLTQCCEAGIFLQGIGPRDSRLLYVVVGSSELAATVLLDIPAVAAEIGVLEVNRLRFFSRYDASSPPGARRDGDVTGHGIT